MKTVSAIGAALALAACSTQPVAPTLVRTAPATDCKALVGTDRNAELPGYLIKQESKLMSPAPFAPIKR